MYTVKGAWACTGCERRIMSQISAVKTRPRSSAGMCLRMLIETPADLGKVQRTLFLLVIPLPETDMAHRLTHLREPKCVSGRLVSLRKQTRLRFCATPLKRVPMEPTEPRSASLTNADPGTPPTASLSRRRAREYRALRLRPNAPREQPKHTDSPQVARHQVSPTERNHRIPMRRGP